MMKNILSYESKQGDKKSNDEKEKVLGRPIDNLKVDCFEEDIFDAFEPGETLEPSQSTRTIAVAWCVEIEKAVHAEEVTHCQGKHPGKELTFRCPECHVGLAYVLRYEGVPARMYFVEKPQNKEDDFISLSQRGTKDHRYCLMRTVETKWLPRASQERILEIMSFRQFEKVFAQLEESENALSLSLVRLQEVIKSFEPSVSGLDQKSTANITLGYMVEFEKRTQKKKAELQQQLYHLSDAYKDFRHEIRGY